MWPAARYALLTALTGFALIACATYGWRQSPRPRGAREFVFINAAIATHAIAYACCLMSPTLAWANFFFDVEMVGITAIPVAILAFAFRYAGRPRSPRFLALVAVLPVVTLLAAWTNEWHEALATDVVMETVDGMLLRRAGSGPLWWVFLAYVYACIIVSSALYLATWLLGSVVHRRQSLLLLLGIVVPLIANIVYHLAARPVIDLTPFAYSVTAVSWTWALTRLELLDLAPVAHDVVLRSIEELVLVLDARGRVVSVNRAAEEFLQRSERELLGKPASTLMGGALVRVRADDAQEEIEVEERYFTVRRTSLGNRGDGSVIVLRDTTLRRETEDAREAALVAARETTRMRSELLARTSHEIRTPLHGILGSADLLADTNLDAAQRRWVEAIVDCGASLLEIVNAVLDLEQARAGRMRGRLAPFDPTVAATGVIALFEGAAARRGLALRLVAEGVPTCVLGDVLRTRQMLSNLVGNAVKFADHGLIQVRLAYAAGWLELAVEDEGPGMDAQTMAKLFVTFEPGDGSAVRARAGSGLGLALTREIASAMGGTVSVQAHQGGTRALLRLPFVETAAVESSPSRSQAHRGRVLVVDDHPLNTAIVQARLEALGCTVLVTHRAEEGVAMAAREVLDLVLMDVHMPEVSGVDATRAIRAAEGTRRVPIVGLSADTQATTRAACLDAGMDDLLGKPFETERFERVLARYLTLNDAAEPGTVELALARAWDAYRATVRAELAELQAAITQPDSAEAARLAHRLRGAASFLALESVAGACAVIEHAERTDLTPAFQALSLAVDRSLQEAA